MADKHKVQIRIGQFTYYRELPNPRDPDGKPVLKIAVANQGDEIEVNEADYQKGKRLDAFGDPEAERRAALAESAEGFDASTAGVDELVEYLRDQEPTVDETVELAGEDPDQAQRVLDAENALAAEEGDEPRKGVVERLERIIEE